MANYFEVHDDRFRNYLLGNVWVESLFTGSLWAEGPVWFADSGYLVWSDIPNNRMLCWKEGLGTTVFRSPSNYSNGNTRDRQGRLVSCEHGARRVSRTEPDGSVTVLVDKFDGKRLNSPNDVVVKSDGTIWFTDPPYGILSNYEGYKADSEIGANLVYRLDPESKQLSVASDDFDKPNGLAFSPDESILYISDTGLSHNVDGPHHIRAFNVGGDGVLSGGEVFADVSPGVSDGFRLDTEGNIWTSAGDGIHCYAPDGTMLGKILIPEKVSNCTFGGARGNRLFITATTSLYAIYLNASGAQTP